MTVSPFVKSMRAMADLMSTLAWGSPTPARWYDACQASLAKSARKREAVRHRPLSAPALIVTLLVVALLILAFFTSFPV